MSWGTEFTAEMYLKSQQFSSIESLKSQMDDVQEQITSYRNQMLIWVASDITKLIPDDWDDEPIVYINLQISELIDNLQSSTIELYELQLLLENYETKINV